MPALAQGLAHLKPVESSTLNARVYAHLRHGLMAGKFRPGEILTLRALAAALGTSVMPARDAVLRLSAEHALEPNGRGVRVPVLDDAQVRDILRFRIALEGEAVALAAERSTDADLLAIERARVKTDRMCASGRLNDFLAANQEFHFAIYRAAHNPLLQTLIETLWLQIGPHLAFAAAGTSPSQCRAIDLTAHVRLVDAIKRGDAEAARVALTSDLSDRDEVFSTLRDPMADKMQARS